MIGGEIQNLEHTVHNIAIVFGAAAGKPAPDPPVKTFRRRLKVKDQVLVELVFDLRILAEEFGGEFTLDKDREADRPGSLVEALELLRDHLPEGIVPNALPLGTIQKIASACSQREWKFNRTAIPERYLRLQKKWPHLTFRECIQKKWPHLTLRECIRRVAADIRMHRRISHY
jgi:hypothetical protein